MFYVYEKHIGTNRENFIKCFSDIKEAIQEIANNYRIDKGLNQLGEYYYFMVQH